MSIKLIHAAHDIARDHYDHGVGTSSIVVFSIAMDYIYYVNSRCYYVSEELDDCRFRQERIAHSLHRLVHRIMHLGCNDRAFHYTGVYWEEPIPTDLADRVSASFPNKFLRVLHRRATNAIAEADKYMSNTCVFKRCLIVLVFQGTTPESESQRVPFEFWRGQLWLLPAILEARRRILLR